MDRKLSMKLIRIKYIENRNIIQINNEKIYIRVIFIIITIIIVCSCSTTHQSNAFFSIYESIDNGVSSPMFITQKKIGKTFEIYSPVMHIITIGIWETKGDTLMFTPSLDCTVEKGKLNIENLNDSIKTVTSILHGF